MNPFEYLSRGDIDFFKTVQLSVLQESRDESSSDSLLSRAAWLGNLSCCKVIYVRCSELLYCANPQGATPLHRAAYMGNDSVVSFLMNAKGEMERKGIMEEDIESGMVEEVVDSKLLMMATYNGKHTALHFAAMEGHLESVKLMLKWDAIHQLKMANSMKETAMHLAVKENQLEIVKLFLRTAPDHVYSGNHQGHTPLFIAWKKGVTGNKSAVQIRKLLMEKQPDQCKVLYENNEGTLLHFAASNDDLDTIKDIILYYPDCCEVVNKEGQNFLHVAAKYDNVKAVNYIMELTEVCDKILNAQDKDGNTALHIATRRGNLSITLSLLDKAKVNKMITNSKGKKALDLASRKLLEEITKSTYPIQCATKGDIDFFEAVEVSVLQNSKDEIDDSILMVAARYGHLRCCEVIYEKCPDLLYYTSNEGASALHRAAKMGKDNVVKFLISAASKVLQQGIEEEGIESGKEKEIAYSKLLTTITSNNKHTALHFAVLNGNLQSAKLLVEADPNKELVKMVNINNETAMHLAVKNHHLEIVELLVENDPKHIYPPDVEGDTPLVIALNEAIAGDIKPVAIRRHLIKSLPSHCREPINKDNWTILHHVAVKADVSAIEEILEFCTDCSELVDKDGYNFLHLAVKHGKENVVRYILGSSKISENVLNSQDKHGNTPLHLATQGGNADLAKSLLYDHRVKIKIPNSQGNDALAMIKFPYDKRRAKYGFANTVDERELKNRSDFDLLVGALICTVSFTAGITVPGGFSSEEPNKGKAILYTNNAFKVFMVANTIAFASSLYAVFSHFCTKHLEDERYVLHQLHMASLCSVGAIFALMVSFVSGSFAVLSVSTGLSVIISVICGIFFISACHPMWRMICQLKQRQHASE